MISKFSISYNKINPNFAFININKQTEVKEFASIFAVTKNILNRSANVKPSVFLLEKLTSPSIREDYIYSIDDSKKEWTNTIKGGVEQNPALRFYEEILKKELGGSQLLYSSFIPECLVEDFIYDKTNKKGEAVDFYSPLLNLVIEIDGSQHNQQEQKILDNERDKKLIVNKIDIARIPVGYIENSFVLRNKISTIIKKIKESIVSEHIKFDDLSETDKNYLGAIRFQILLLELLSNGYISLREKVWEMNICLREKLSEQIFTHSMNDLLDIIQDVANLQNIQIERPDLILNFVKEDSLHQKDKINIDFSINMKYDEQCFDKNSIIYVRNDYFLYSKFADTKKELYSRYKNYYEVSVSECKYKIEMKNELHHQSLLNILRRVFGFNDFNPNQEELIVNCLNGQSVVGLLPTSAGKSLCYQLSAMLCPSATLVIAPLNSLMEDQYNNMVEYGIENILYLNSTNKDNLENLKNNKSLITIVSPERFFSSTFTEFLSIKAKNFGLIVLDEVHCLSEWGHDFRTSYLCLFHSLNKYFSKDNRLIGLTATASPNVSDDIVAEFNSFKKRTLLISAYSLERKELNLVPLEFGSNRDKFDWLKGFVDENKELNDKTVVFTKFAGVPLESFPSSCKYLQSEMSAYTKIADETIDYYTSEDKNESEYNNSVKLQNFKTGRTRLLFSTKAFGMGVNIPDIRNTIHYGLPASIESLYQEFGRAGRDKKNSNCYILYNKETDENISILNSQTIQKLREKMGDMRELNGNLFFLTSSHKDIDPETKMIMSVLNYLKKTNKTQYTLDSLLGCLEGKSKSDNKNTIDRALYRLFLLGIIEMWGMVYGSDMSNPTYTNVLLTNISEEDMVRNMERYIGRYNLDRIEKYHYEGEMITQEIIKELVVWSFKHFTQNQIDSLKNLYEYCSKYKTSKELMGAIVQFLTTDPGLRGVLEDETTNKWFEYLNETVPEERQHKVNRMLESYGSSTALDYISGITRLELNNFENTDGEQRFRASLENLNKKEDSFKKKIIDKTLSYLKDNENIEQIVPVLLDYMPEYLNEIYLATGSEYCAKIKIKQFKDKLDEIGGGINARCRKDG